jgi:hypothetical protein
MAGEANENRPTRSSFDVFIYVLATILTTGCLVTGILTLFILSSDGSPITGIPSRWIGIPMIVFCPIAALPAALLSLIGSDKRRH